ncbi:MAG: NAD(P)-dependent oxidoreductase [Epsilonproteobacteria bacterium]|nr:NAD(P)-dependent oxidoreductase [Campylobacterota bacterium]PIP10355.1 MAG: hypothetical protein COX50_06215 [Sulfurimonas sp. CG23_combo_of_CG06-09_8_20_14_all_36_33]PIS23827.1 MAG: hypothetical protein COT46_11605 [Sulfurimonas sp. CG08_land_8_20_14_0_20_36_33]PIU34790.1 MAG: hypothetical protein COT05_06175 [Sulfurimonas sp. CG07_land_8_20_14_0_80_36_56]PIV05534.1 MAG: hypothetical protein COS56_00935 [Sulfurimonas sp. CG03_land_8_20_14_0_80_36_25]PIV36929.1 MAG: hypothetical protein COS
MIIGTGQLAKAFDNANFDDNVCIFASGVSDSNCKDNAPFEREKNLLREALKNNVEKKFIYFSSCALSASEYPKNEYYCHKQAMEDLIQTSSDNYYIFRIPQLFGALKHHKTLINFIYESIVQNKKFTIYDGAFRYVIEIEDVKKLIKAYISNASPCCIIDITNPYRYSILEIVHIFEKLLGKKASYDMVNKSDEYTLDLSKMQDFIEKNELDIDFSNNYLEKKLKEKIMLLIEGVK